MMITPSISQRASVFIVVLTSMFATGNVASQTCYQPRQALNENTAAIEGVVVDGNRALVTISNVDAAGGDRGFIYERQNNRWRLKAGLLPPFTILPGGAPAALDGDIALRATTPNGTIHVFRRVTESEWTLEQSIVAHASAIAVRGNLIAAGNLSDSEAGIQAGAVRLYRYNGSTWALEQKILYPEGVPRGRFGQAVAFVDDKLVVGAPQTVQGDPDPGGRAYIFSKNGEEWTLEQTIVPTDIMPDDGFGKALAYDDNSLCIGSRDAVYVFSRGNAGESFVELTKLTVPDDDDLAPIGGSIAIDNGKILAGAPTQAAFGTDTGRAYLFTFENGSWEYSATIWPPVFNSHNEFGKHVAIADDQLLISAPDEYISNGRGVVHVFEVQSVEGDDCNKDGIPDACEPMVDCNQNGIPDICDVFTGAFYDCDGDMILDVCEIADGADDCNQNLIDDRCEIANGLVTDCDNNNVPDDCDLAAGDDDCNHNLIHDRCEIDSGLASDCNLNLVPDDCEIAGGLLDDCNDDGVADVCQTNDYVVDSPLPNLEGWHVTVPADSLWMNRFIVQSGSEVINSVDLYVTQEQQPIGPIILLVYDDPNNDGDPLDGELIYQESVTSYEPGQWNRFSIHPTYVGEADEIFFVGILAAVDVPPATRFYQAIDGDRNAPPVSWWGIGNPGEVDIHSLTGFSVIGLSLVGTGELDVVLGAWRIRADAMHYEGVPTDCMCPGNISEGGVRGASGDDREVNVHDLFALLANWGECGEPCAPFCAGDISGAHGLPDCVVDMFDLMAMLERWGKCE